MQLKEMMQSSEGLDSKLDRILSVLEKVLQEQLSQELSESERTGINFKIKIDRDLTNLVFDDHAQEGKNRKLLLKLKERGCYWDEELGMVICEV